MVVACATMRSAKGEWVVAGAMMRFTKGEWVVAGAMMRSTKGEWVVAGEIEDPAKAKEYGTTFKQNTTTCPTKPPISPAISTT